MICPTCRGKVTYVTDWSKLYGRSKIMNVKMLRDLLWLLPGNVNVFLGDQMSATSDIEVKVIDNDLHIIGK